MIGESENSRRCPLCGGALRRGEATIPFVLSNDVIVIVKHTPAQVCEDCAESFTEGAVTDQLLAMLRHLKNLRSEVSVVSYIEVDSPVVHRLTEPQPA